MSRKNEQKQDSLEKFLKYILGVRPDEFGLYPDGEGFVAMKALLAAFHDEEGWRGVREGQIMMLVNQPGGASPFEVAEGKIRLKPALASLPPEAPTQPPKLLYCALKPTAWPVICERGLYPKTGETVALLWAGKDMALKVGHRLSPEPVLVTVQAAAALKGGAEIAPYSDLVWLAKSVGAQYLSGPPVPPKEKEKALPGAFPLPAPEPVAMHGKKRGKHSDEPEWKNKVRKERRRGEKF